MAKQAVSGECREGRGKRGKVGGHTIWQSQTRVRFFDFCLATHTFWRLGADFRACSDSRFIRSSSFLIYYFQLFFYTLLLLASRKKLVTTRCLLSFHALPLPLPSLAPPKVSARNAFFGTPRNEIPFISIALLFQCEIVCTRSYANFKHDKWTRECSPFPSHSLSLSLFNAFVVVVGQLTFALQWNFLLKCICNPK